MFASTGCITVFNTNLAWFVIYKLELQIFEQYKIEKDKLWPWKKDREAWVLKIKNALGNIVFNTVITSSLSLLVYLWVCNWEFKFMDMRMDTVPTPFEFAKQLGIICLMDDFCFYWTHRLFHCKHRFLPLYQWIHKQHHEFA